MKNIFLKTSIATAISLISFTSFAASTFGTEVKIDNVVVQDSIKEALANGVNQSVSIVNTDEDKRAVHVDNDTVSILGNQIDINGIKGVFTEAIRAENGSTLNIGSDKTEKITLQSSGDVVMAKIKSSINHSIPNFLWRIKSRIITKTKKSTSQNSLLIIISYII